MHFSRLLGRAALVVLASAFAAPAPVLQSVLVPTLGAQLVHRDTSPNPEITRLELVGVSRNVDQEDLRANIFTTATRCASVILAPVCRFTRYRGFEERHYLDRRELARDMLRMRVWYYKHGYREAQVDTAVIPLSVKQVAVRFVVHEGTPTLVRAITVDHDTTLLGRRRVEELTLLHAGAPLDLVALDSTRVFFQNELWELGYADALIDTSTVVDPIARTASVQFRLVPNHLTRVGTIEIAGTEKVSPSTVQNALTFREGDVYRRSAVIESQRNLYESNLFRLATLDVPQSFDSIKAVRVTVREAPLHAAKLGFGFNTVDFIQTEARYTHYNLFGAARRLDASATVGNLFARTLNGAGIFHQQDTSSVSEITGTGADFLQPTYQTSVTLVQPGFLRRPRTSLGVGAFAQRRSVPAVVIDRGYGGNLTVTHALGYRAPLSATYRYEQTKVEANDAYFCVNFGVCETTTIGVLRSHQSLSPVTLQAQVDRSDVPLAPTRGYVARGEAEMASAATLSDYRYFRTTADGALYARLGPRSTVLASHLRVGFVRPFAGPNGGDAVLHPRKRFYAGGSQSVRGFGQNQLGPRILTIPHDYLVFARDASGAAFCDASTAATIRACDPNTAVDLTEGRNGNFQHAGRDDYFTARPLGGTSVIEASVEYRFPLPLFSNLGGAVFVDGAAVGERILDPLGGGLQTLTNLVTGQRAISPGVGVRYYSPVGPIRVDLGFNPSRTENLAVVTEVVQNGKRTIVPLDLPKSFAPIGTRQGGIRGILNRLTLHLSIGQAY